MSDVRTALEAARDAFKSYGEQHMAKDPPQVEKARVNRDLFNLMEAGLAKLATMEQELAAFDWVAGLYDDRTLTRAEVAAELSDFQMVIGEVPLVYDHVTGGLISKANSNARAVIAAHDDHVTRTVEDAVREASEGCALDAAMADVLQFHRTFQIYLPVGPTPQDAFLRDRRAAFIRSECDELDVAITLADQADAYMDVIYFAVGGLVELGLEGSPLWRIVHGANMAKLWPDGQPRHREGDRKIMKPPGWEDPRPQLEAEVDRQLKKVRTMTIALGREPDFIIGEVDNPYLLRWWVIPRNRLFNIYLHHMMRDDDDRALHDHPWWNVSIVLRGGFWEIMPNDPRYWPEHIWRWRGPGAIVFRLAKAAHRLALPKPGAYSWSLFITGPKFRTWGFHCPKGRVPWTTFVTKIGNTSVGKGCE